MAAVGTVLALAGCSGKPNDLRQGYGANATATQSAEQVTASSTAPPTTSTAPSTVDADALRRKLTSALLTEQVLAAEDLGPSAPPKAASRPPELACGISPQNVGQLSGGMQASWVSQSGQSTLVQFVATGAEGGGRAVVEAVRAKLTCANYSRQGKAVQVTGKLDLADLSGVDDQFAWCERATDNTGSCTLVLAADDLVTVVRLDTISEARARTVLPRIAPKAAEALTTG
ncbi:hypothetical protein [Goodfellowiella coeruleoviolacea]|uniref:hypothetical protein n=1 Tax=Goodfellowiella coeruleoviolacea TaxID=334858 RepID=UPI0020A48B4C|nr:hypothetical protein [Goodfellowiella coeruleoviolacea]